MNRRFDDQNMQIEGGWTVLDSDGNNVGAIKHCTDTYCHIDTGFLGLGEDYYVPKDAIQDVEVGKVYLDIPKDQLKTTGWNNVPPGCEDVEAAAHGTGSRSEMADLDAENRFGERDRPRSGTYLPSDVVSDDEGRRPFGKPEQGESDIDPDDLDG